MKEDQINDLESKYEKLRTIMELKKADGCLLTVDVNLFYMTGRVFDGFLYLPVDGDPFFFVKKPNDFEGKNVVFIRKPEQLPEMFEKFHLKMPRKLMLEADELPFNEYNRLLTAFHVSSAQNATSVLREMRSIKTGWEIEQTRMSGKLHDKTYADIPKCYRTGMTDLEFQIEIERLMRLNGSFGLLRAFGLNMNTYIGNVLAGENAEAPSPFDFALGGAGQTPFSPIGANGTKLEEGMSVMVDVAGNYMPYMTDMSRVFSIGKLNDLALHAHQVSIDIHNEIARYARPGIACADLYNRAAEIAEKEELSEYFMGWTQKAKFIGHGVGLQINELPVIAPRSKEALSSGMIIALEPKFVIPGTGAVGIENTYLVNDDGLEKLTLTNEEIIELK